MPTIQQVANVMAEKQAIVPGKRVRLDFGDTGSLYLDGVANTVTLEGTDPDTTISLSFDDFLAMTEGRLSGTMAFMQGKLRITGDMGVAFQLQSVTSKMSR